MPNTISNSTTISYPTPAIVDTWADREPELRRLAEPLLESAAFERLAGITFLGILSPRYCNASSAVLDGSREDHSRGVAAIALDIARQLGLTATAQRYAVAWGLVHDIATWPLSHTSEPAFERITGVGSRTLRRKIVLGSTDVPARYRLVAPLREMAIDATVLLRLFDADSPPQDTDLAILWQIIHSPITPDTLEGMWRAGQVFGIRVPHPGRMGRLVRRRGRVAFVDSDEESALSTFWTAKSAIYDHFINREDAVAWESDWARAILRCFERTKLAQSLSLSERDLVRGIGQPERLQLAEHYRYKAPHAYFLSKRAKSHLTSTTSIEVQKLSEFLKKDPKRSCEHGKAGRSEEVKPIRQWAFSFGLPACL